VILVFQSHAFPHGGKDGLTGRLTVLRISITSLLGAEHWRRQRWEAHVHFGSEWGKLRLLEHLGCVADGLGVEPLVAPLRGVPRKSVEVLQVIKVGLIPAVEELNPLARVHEQR